MKTFREMGIKNTIDSSTLANKCLEVIEAKYLFDIDFNKIEEAKVKVKF